MPFTGAHPFAILPLTRWRWLDPTCLAIGAMAPDFEYFARGHLSGGKLGHTWPGIAIWCVPLTLVIALIYHRVVKRPLIDALPRAIARRLRDAPWPANLVSLGTVVSLVVSAALGGATHLAWDAFTHDDGFVVLHVRALRPHVDQLQLGCSIVGLAGLALALVRRWWHTPPIDPGPARGRWIFVTCIPIAVALVVWHARAIGATTSGDLLVAPISGALAGILVASAIVRAT